MPLISVRRESDSLLLRSVLACVSTETRVLGTVGFNPLDPTELVCVERRQELQRKTIYLFLLFMWEHVLHSQIHL